MRFALSFAACALVACATSSPPPRSQSMSSDSKALVQRLYDDYLNPGHLDRLGDVVAADFVGPAPQPGPAGFAASMRALRAGFPDLRYRLDDVIAEGDRVAVRWTWSGTHTGTFRGFAATGKRIVNTGFAVFHVVDGKLARGWVETDRLGFLLAIGAVPYDPAFGPPPAAAN